MNPCQNDITSFPVTNTIEAIHLQIMKMIRTRLHDKQKTSCIQFCENQTLISKYLSRERKIGPTWLHACRTTRQVAVWTITSLTLNVAAYTKMNAAARKSVKMTSPRMKYSRHRPTTVTRRPTE